MAKSAGRATWFKLFLHNKAVLDAMPDETVGKAIKAIFNYFENGEIPDLDPMAFVAFSSIKPSVDESFVDYAESVENGKKGGRPPKGGKPPVTPPNDGLPYQTEAEADVEADTEQMKKKEGRKADEPPRTRFVVPTVEEVKEYCKERNNNVDPQRFVDYYTSNGWMVGRNKMKDWKAAVRSWENKDKNQGVNNGQVARNTTEERHFPGTIVL